MIDGSAPFGRASRMVAISRGAISQSNIARPILASTGCRQWPYRAMREWYATRRVERQAQRFEMLGDNLTRFATGEQPAARRNVGETVSEAAEAWLAELKRDEAPRDTTLQGHRDRVRAFVGKVGD